MIPTFEEQKKECLIRLKLSGLCREVITDFQNGQLYKTEQLGILYYANDKEKAVVKDFEEKNNAMVYHILHSNTEFGELLALLYVSKHKEEWQMDREDLKDNIALSYVYNVDCPDLSEFGSIGFAQRLGGLVRTA